MEFSYISGGNLESLKIKKSYTFSYNYKRAFFSFYIFCYTQQAFVFHLLRDFCNVHDHIVAFFLCFL